MLNTNETFTTAFAVELLLKDSAVFGVREGAKHIPKMPILREELVNTTNEIARELFRHIICNHYVAELKQLLNGYERFYNDILLEASGYFLTNEYDIDQIIPLNYELRRLAYHACKDENRKYWLDSLNKWIEVTTPNNNIFQYGWIFYEYYSFFSFEDDGTEVNIDGRIEKNDELRKTTLAKMVLTNTPSEVSSLVKCSKDDYHMGFFYGRNLSSEYIYEFAKKAHQYKKNRLLCGIIEAVVKTDCLFILNLLKAEDQLIVLSSISRTDIIDWLDTSEKEHAFWSHQMMREYNEDNYNKLLVHNPFNLISYYAYLTERPLLTNIEKVKEVIGAVLTTTTTVSQNNNVSYALDRIISTLSEEKYEATEWAELCAKLYDNGWLQQYPDILKEYYFSHPDILCDKLLTMNANAYSQFNFHYKLPNRAYTDSHAFAFFVDVFFDKHTEKDFLISVLGSILGKSSEGTDMIFPHENVRVALEKYKEYNLWRDVLIGKINSRGCRTIGDGSNEKRIAEEYKCNAKKVEIIFPETAKLLWELSNEYAHDGKQDLLFSELGTSAFY